MIKQKRGRLPGNPPELEVVNNNMETETLKVKGHCRILGLNVQNNLTWNSHLESGTKSLLPGLRRNLGALRTISKQIPLNCRNILARGMILSRLSYLISIWGGATPNLIRKAQVIQNGAARWVTGSMRTTRASTLLELTGWFSIREMAHLQSANTIWKIIHQKTPMNLHKTLKWDEDTLIFEMKVPRINFTENSFTHRACTLWNKIPDDIRNLKTIGNFKKHMKLWIKTLRPRMPD